MLINIHYNPDTSLHFRSVFTVILEVKDRTVDLQLTLRTTLLLTLGGTSFDAMHR